MKKKACRVREDGALLFFNANMSLERRLNSQRDKKIASVKILYVYLQDVRTIMKMKGMKRAISAAVACIIALAGYAQDTISLMNGQKIAAKVERIANGQVEYKKYTNPNGPTYVENDSKIGYIRYQNGEVEYYGMQEPQPVVVEAAPVEIAPVEDIYVVPTRMGMLRHDKHSASFVSLDRNKLSVERAYEVMGDRYDDFIRHRNKWKNWKKCWLIGIGVTAVATPCLAVGARKTNSNGLDMATIFVPVGGMAAIAIGAAKSSKHKRRMMSKLGMVEY